jgi:hypothetical protein
MPPFNVNIWPAVRSASVSTRGRTAAGIQSEHNEPRATYVGITGSFLPEPGDTGNSRLTISRSASSQSSMAQPSL